MGDYGPTEISGYRGKAGLPDPKELHNAEVEEICRKYLELRYRLLPYTYTVAREAHDTGLPVMRPLWLHHSDESRALECSDEYLWGRDLLVAPVTEKGAVSRSVYLPRGVWYDLWSEEKLAGERVVNRKVDLATLPLYVRAGTILPLGPVKQYAVQKLEQPLTLTIYPGSDGEFVLYEDDGLSFDYAEGKFMRLRLEWQDRNRRLTLRLVGGSRMLEPVPRAFRVRVAGTGAEREMQFNGQAQTVQL